MKIILDPEWYIEDDGAGYTLIKFSGEETRNVNKDGELIITKKYDYKSYPPTIASCIEKYIRLKMVEKHDAINLREYMTEFKEETKRLVEMIKSLGITR